MTGTEPFPNMAAHQYVQPNTSSATSEASQTRRRRRSSSLPADLHGDTDVPALATMKRDPTAAADAAKRHATEKALRPHSKRRKAKSLLRRWRSISIRHTWLNPLLIVIAVLGLYLRNPTPSNPFHAAIFLSYPLAPLTPGGPIQYGKGARDFAFVAFYTVFLTFTREFFMQRILRPMAVSWGLRSRGKQFRFMEQYYTALYFAIFGPYGLYVMSRTPIWYFNTSAMFEGFPHRQHEGLFKAYYLLQAAYWLQQAMVIILLLEKPRKDFKELVMHHVLTIALIWCSYRFHFTYMGIAVYITHDVSDFFLATSKCLHYLSHPFTAPFYGVFVFVWLYLRHYLNLRILYAVLTEFATVGPYELNWETQQYKCWISQVITFALLAGLQSINLIWLFYIMRILKRILIDNVKEDIRSEASDDEEEEAEVEEVGRVGEGKTEEKRRMLGLNGNAGVGASLHEQQQQPLQSNGHATPPKVLINGQPIIGTKPASANAKAKTSGVRSVEISAQERKTRVR